jgi:predicted DsbA family dithiol-disulfide isomerase
MLNPNMVEKGEDIKTHITKKYGARGAAMVDDPNSHLMRAGRAVGIEFTNNRNMYPTLKAHKLMEYVKTIDNDKANQLMEVMYTRYFEKGDNINDASTLVALAEQLGINKDEASRAVQDEELWKQVREKDHFYKNGMNIHGVPYYIIDRNDGGRPIGFSGAQPPDIIAEQLEIAAEE